MLGCLLAAFHASTAFTGPTLINNTFLNSGDDGIAIHGRYYLVVAVSLSSCASAHLHLELHALQDPSNLQDSQGALHSLQISA